MASQNVPHASDKSPSPQGSGDARSKIEAALRQLLTEGGPDSDAAPGRPAESVNESFALRLYERLRGVLPEGELSFPCPFGKYELLEELGRGGMGVIYKARDTELDRVVALKRILTGRFASEAEVARFTREAKAAAALDHPCIVPIYEVGSYHGHEFFAMKLLEGGSLLERAVDLARTSDEIAALMERLARAVAYAHERGILHRDLKRANILFDGNDQPYIADFGLARRLGGDPSLTASGGFVGTLRYLAPEVVSGRGDGPSTAVDIYGIGVIIYELLTGQPPFSEVASSDLLRRISEDEPVPPSRLRPVVHRDLETICLRCLEKDPAARYPSAAAVAEELGRVRRGEPIVARRAGPGERLWKWVRRRPSAAALAALSALIALAIPILGIWYVADLGERARELEREKELARRYMYAARLNLATEAWKDGLYHRGKEILKSVEPAEGDTDLRSFGWHFLESALTPERWGVRGHESDLVGVQLLSGGDRLVSASTDGVLRLWDIRTGELVAEDVHPSGRVEWCYFSPDGRFAARCVGAPELVFQVSELVRDAEGVRWRVALDYPHEVTAAGFSRERRLAATTNEGTLLVWDTASWDNTASVPFLRLHWEIRFSADGRRFSSTDDSGKLRLFDLLNGRALSHPDLACFKGALSPDWRHAAIKPARNDPVEIRAAQTWQRVSRLPDTTDLTLAMRTSPDGRRLVLAVGESLPRVEVWDLERLEKEATLYAHGGYVTCFSFSEDGTRLATGSKLGEVKVWDFPPTALPIRHETSEGRYERVSVSDGLVVACRRGFSFEGLRIEHTPPEKPRLRVLGVLSSSGEGLAGEALAPSGRRVALSYPDGRVELHALRWDGPEPTAKGESFITPGGEIVEMAFATDDALLVAETEAEAEAAVSLWELQPDTSWRSTKRLPVAGTITGLYPSSDKRTFVLTTAESPALLLCDLDSGQTSVLRGHSGTVYAVAFSPDGRWLASGARDHTVLQWDVSDWRARGSISPVRVLRGHTNAVGGLVFFGDGETLASASDDKTIKLWDLKTGAEKATLTGHGYHINALARAADDSTLVSVGGHRKRRIGELLVWSAVHAEQP